MRTWDKRKLFSMGFKDRPRRALLWRKPLYREWFEYVKLYEAERGMKLSHFRAFGPVQQFEFEEWWRHPSYGFELFCEPELVDLVKVVDGRSKKVPNAVTLSVQLNADSELIIRDFKTLMKTLCPHTEYQSQARFQPSAPMQHLKPDKLKQARQAYVLSQRMPQKEAIKRLYKRGERAELQYDENGELLVSDPRTVEFQNWEKGKLRVLSYHRKTVKQIFANLEKGQFP